MKIRIKDKNSIKDVDIYSDEGFKLIAELWTKVSFHNRVMHKPTWLGIPIVQYPNDIVMMQELIWKVRPDVIVETGVAHGGTAILYASILELLGKGKVIGIEIEIREHNKIAIENHHLSKRINLIEGSSIDEDIAKRAKTMIKDTDKVIIVLDSNHSYKHVLREIELYSSLVSPNGYLVVMDGVQEMLWDVPSGKEEWRHDNPLMAIREFLKKNPEWQVDNSYTRLNVTTNHSGFLMRRK